jgi:hypothetical protein
MSLVKPNSQIHPDKTPVAQEVKTYCTREKTDTFHIVMNHDRMGYVDRVKCKACGSEHKYKKTVVKATVSSTPKTAFVRSNSGTLMVNPAAPKSSSASKGASRGSGSAQLEDSWFLKIKKWGEKPVRDYNPQENFDLNEVFKHEVFGKGAVQTRRENKIDVLFQVGLKTLPSKK